MVDYEWMHWAWAQAWQLTALIVVVAIVARCFARRRPHLAYVLWLVVLAKCLTPPVIASPAGIFCRLQSFVGMAACDEGRGPDLEIQRDELPLADWEGTSPIGASVVSRADEQKLAQSDEKAKVEFETTIAGRSERSSRSEGVVHHFSGRRATSSIAQPFVLLSVAWLVGTLLVILGMLWRMIACLRRLRRQGFDSRPELDALLVDLRQRLQIRQRVRLLVTRGSIGPAVFGFFRPTIVLPSIVAAGRSSSELEAILAHELIHIRRGDLWTGLVQVLAQGVWWFHPLVWFANRRAILIAETCCDQETITELCCDPAAYAESLLDILAIRNKLVPVPLFPGVKPVDVTRERLERIMQIGQGCPRRTPWWCWMAMVLVAAATLPGAAIVTIGDDKPTDSATADTADDSSAASNLDDALAAAEDKTEVADRPLVEAWKIRMQSSGGPGKDADGNRRGILSLIKTDVPEDSPIREGLMATGDTIDLSHLSFGASPRDEWTGIRILGDVQIKLGNLHVRADDASIRFPTRHLMLMKNDDEGTSIIVAFHGNARVIAAASPKDDPNRTTASEARSEKGEIHAAYRMSLERQELWQARVALSGNTLYHDSEREISADWLSLGMEALKEDPRFLVSSQLDLSGKVEFRSRTAQFQKNVIQAGRVTWNSRDDRLIVHPSSQTKGAEQVPNVIGTVSKIHASPTAKEPDDASAKKAFHQRISLHFKEAPLSEVLASLSQLLKVSVNLAPVGLTEKGIAASTRVSIDVEDVPAREAFQKLLAPLGLVAIVESGEMIRVMTREQSSHPMRTMTYPVADLIVPVQRFRVNVTDSGLEEIELGKTDPAPANKRKGIGENADFSNLIELITSTVSPDTWDEVGGPGSIRPFETTLSLVVRQNQAVHDEIAALLGQLRRLQDLQITLELSALRVPAEFEPELTFPLEDRDVRAELLGAQEVTALRKAAETHSHAGLYVLPRASLLNGQGFEINVPQFGNRSPAFQFLPLISPHRLGVRLSLAVGAKDPIDAMSRVSTFSIPADTSLVVDVTDELKTKPVAGLRPGQIGAILRGMKVNPGERCLLLITPRFPAAEKVDQL